MKRKASSTSPSCPGRSPCWRRHLFRRPCLFFYIVAATLLPEARSGLLQQTLSPPSRLLVIGLLPFPFGPSSSASVPCPKRLSPSVGRAARPKVLKPTFKRARWILLSLLRVLSGVDWEDVRRLVAGFSSSCALPRSQAVASIIETTRNEDDFPRPLCDGKQAGG